MNANYFLFFTTFVVCLGLITGTEVKQCKSGVPMPLRVDITNCDKLPCQLTKGTFATMNLTFEAPQEIVRLEPKVVATALGINVPYPLDEPNGCKSLIDSECPLEEGQVALLSTTMEIKSIFPPISVTIELSLHTENDDGELYPFACIVFDAKVN